MEIEYVNEHLFPGLLGNFFIVLAFIASLVATYAYYRAAKDSVDSFSWHKLGNLSFMVHSIGVLGIIGTLFHLLFNHYYEYYYVWQHSSDELPMRYILSCFWEGQEGSFLLWTFWHVVLGLVLMTRKHHSLQAPAMSIVSLVQVFLGSMLLGVTVLGEYTIGSNPFGLLREHPDMANLPFISNPNYTELIQGRGLNPLLQNYWMTIHPPTLFLGFASTTIPFAYAIAGLWKRQYIEWIKPTLKWTFFGIAVLGTGILMGGAWAYEALSFGGFWAWDPVENASLVPWLVFVGAGHLMLINQRKPNSLLLTNILTVLSFLLVLYSTYLTRSGILGETSVHSFAEGMPGQLIVYLLFFCALAFGMIIWHKRSIPKLKSEENLWSREFWVFVGSMVLGLSSFQIGFNTSKPVLNVLLEPFSGVFNSIYESTDWAFFKKLAGHNLAIQGDVIDFYNQWQIWFAMIVCILVAVGQFFNYKDTSLGTFFKRSALGLGLALLATVGIELMIDFPDWRQVVLLFTGMYALFGNLTYWIQILKGKVPKAGASIAHIGFALIVLGILLSTGKKEFISVNNSGIAIQMTAEEDEDPNAKNIMLIKGDTLRMGDYYVTYVGSTKEGINLHYEVEYYTGEPGNLKYAFTLKPRVQTNALMGNVPEPDTKHYWNKDVFTHITYADLESIDDPDAYTEPKTVQTSLKDTIATSNCLVIPHLFNSNIDRAKYQLDSSDLGVSLIIEVQDVNGNVYQMEPIMLIKESQIIPIEAVNEELGLRIALKRVTPETGNIELVMSEKKANKKDLIIMQAIVFPYINVLWLGCIVMIIGTVIAIWNRLRMSRGKG